MPPLEELLAGSNCLAQECNGTINNLLFLYTGSLNALCFRYFPALLYNQFFPF